MSEPRRGRVEAQRHGVFVDAWVETPSDASILDRTAHVALRIPFGVHIYGAPAPRGLTALEIGLVPKDDVQAGAASIPAPRPLHLPDANPSPFGAREMALLFGGSQEMVGYEDQVEVVLPFTVQGWAQPVTVDIRVHFQACNNSVCFPADEVTLQLALL
ncbi:MAG: hypothetical protein EXR58_05695 [Chloroflexi bacterium]|nr:hypothetical protein [Chloroflexota bacterium]